MILKCMISLQMAFAPIISQAGQKISENKRDKNYVNFASKPII